MLDDLASFIEAEKTQGDLLTRLLIHIANPVQHRSMQHRK